MFEVVFQNQDLIAVDKPSGWLTVPSRFESEDQRKVLGRELERVLSLQLYPVHRLDFEVSGLVLFALTSGAQKKMNTWFEKQLVQKAYQAFSAPRDFSHWPTHLRQAAEPVRQGEPQLWSCLLLRGKRRSYEHPKGDKAVTEATLLSSLESDPLEWLLKPKTGRSHQLRFEMSRHGFPIHGDALYGSRVPCVRENEIALRAVSLDFGLVPERERLGLPVVLKVEGLRR